MHQSRRTFLKGLTVGTAAGVLIPGFSSRQAFAAPALTSQSTVSFATGKDRIELMQRLLAPFRDELAEKIKGKQVIIKPNMVWHVNTLAATDADATRGVLEFLKPIYKDRVLIAESSASPEGTLFVLEKNGYRPIEQQYNAKLVDLNQGAWTMDQILDSQMKPLDVKVCSDFLDEDNFIISLARMKTHNCVVATLSIKNIMMACPINVAKDHPDFVSNQYEKQKMHRSPNGDMGTYQEINYNIFLMTQKAKPEFAIVDGVVAMEGNGPNDGTPVEHGVALAGFDPIAVDRVGLQLMGINYEDVGYLQWCAQAGLGQGDRNKIQIIGPDPAQHVRQYKLHDNVKSQLTWKDNQRARQNRQD